MPSDRPVTIPTAKVLSAVLEAGSVAVSGAEIARATGLASGTTYPILIRLEQAGWLRSEWEETSPRGLQRPRRRLYSVTPLGHAKIREVGVALAPLARTLAWA